MWLSGAISVPLNPYKTLFFLKYIPKLYHPQPLVYYFPNETSMQGGLLLSLCSIPSPLSNHLTKRRKKELAALHSYYTEINIREKFLREIMLRGLKKKYFRNFILLSLCKMIFNAKLIAWILFSVFVISPHGQNNLEANND